MIAMGSFLRHWRHARSAPYPKVMFVATICLVIVTAGSNSYSKIHKGLGYAEFDSAWDFSDSSTCVLFEGDCGDLAMGITLMQTATEPTVMLMLAMAPHAGIAVASLDSTYEELTTAPEDSNEYFIMVVPYPDVVYVMRTNEGHYAKFRGVDLGPGGDFTLEYSYQDDGTRVLVDDVPTEQTTWGRMKSLYDSR
jgi:hypothetical protein